MLLKCLLFILKIQLLEIQNSVIDNITTEYNFLLNNSINDIMNNLDVITDGIVDNIIEHNNTQKPGINDYSEGTDNSAYPNSYSTFTRSDVKNLFLCKNNLNYIYDMISTINTLDAIKNFKIQFNLYQFNFKNFFETIVSNLKITCKLKRVEVIMTGDSIDEWIYAVYEIYRMIYFNLLLFILNNYMDFTTKIAKESGSIQDMKRDYNFKPQQITVQVKRYPFSFYIVLI